MQQLDFVVGALGFTNVQPLPGKPNELGPVAGAQISRQPFDAVFQLVGTDI